MRGRIATLAVASALSVSMLWGCAGAQAGESAADSAQPAEQQATAPVGFDDVQYVMYVGTNDKDTNKPVFPPEECKEKAKDILIESMGGYTIQDAEGGWKADDGTEYQEYTLVVYLSDTTEEQVHEVAREFIQTFNQSSVLIQTNPTKTEFFDGTE